MRRLLELVVIVVVLAGATAPAVAAVNISIPYNTRDHTGPNTVGLTPGDRLNFGAVAVQPSGPPTTVTATQAGIISNLNFRPSPLFPGLYGANIPFDPALTGQWVITGVRDGETATALTNPIPVPRLLPLVEHVTIFGSGLTPLITWDLPDLTGMSVDRIRIRVHDATTGDALAQFTVFTQSAPGGSGPELGRSMIVPAGLLQYNRSYVFRIMLEDLLFPGESIANRSNTFSEVYTPVTVLAGDGFSLFSDRIVFEGELGTRVLDDYSDPGYLVNENPQFPILHVLSDAGMSAVLGETVYTATRHPNVNIVLSQPGQASRYCAGCNGTFRLSFGATSVGEAGGVFGASFDVFRLVNNSVWTEHPHAFVTFADGTMTSVGLGGGFFGVTANQRIQSIHVGLADGSASDRLYIEIDNLTIGNSPVIGVSIDIKPGSFPNSINLTSSGKVPVAIYGTAAFDVRAVDPATVTLAGARVAAHKRGDPMASLEDVDGDGIPDLVLHFSTVELVLSVEDTEAVLQGRTVDGRLLRGVDSVRIVR
ncbi:MAG: hypothetical protein ACRELZ_09495 [Candidatus Rokuibacteriota bacterium]